MRRRKNTGFTLIELLVVIAIIGMLASITLGYLTNARKKGRDTAVKANLSQGRTQAEMYFSNNGDYGTAGAGTGICATGASDTIGDSIQAAIDASPNLAAYDTVAETCFVGTGSNTWAAAVPLLLPESPQSYFCVDYNGAALIVDTTYPISSSDTTCM